MEETTKKPKAQPNPLEQLNKLEENRKKQQASARNREAALIRQINKASGDWLRDLTGAKHPDIDTITKTLESKIVRLDGGAEVSVYILLKEALNPQNGGK